MNNSGRGMLIAGVISIIIATVTMLYLSVYEKEPENGRFSVITITKPASTSAIITETRTTAKKTEVTVTASTTEPVTEVLMININTAGAEELCLLNGIGEVKADAVIAYRAENGDFHNIEEIMNVSGIGADTFSAIKEHIYVDDPTYPETTSETVTETKRTTAKVTTELPTEPETASIPSLEDVAPININEAGKEELMLLPYVDEETAEAIISLRERIYGYKNVYELLYIDNLSQKQVAEIVGFVTVGQ